MPAKKFIEKRVKRCQLSSSGIRVVSSPVKKLETQNPADPAFIKNEARKNEKKNVRRNKKEGEIEKSLNRFGCVFVLDDDLV